MTVIAGWTAGTSVVALFFVQGGGALQLDPGYPVVFAVDPKLAFND